MEIHVKSHKKPVVIDLFCGAGGESSGLYKAFQDRGMDVELHAVNHWELAIETHSMNHPEAAHYTEDVFKGSPKKHVRNGHVSLLWASPECTYHSRARGKAGELNPQSRAGANVVLDWCQDLTVDRVIVENVEEFRHWSPLDVDGKPVTALKGILFREWVSRLESLGYEVEWRTLCAADMGAPTSRQRLFVQAVRKKSGKRIKWPAPVLARDQWLPAASCIDWSDLGTPLHLRKRPLCENTLRRIEAGINKHWGEWAEPFIAVLRGTSDRAILNSASSIYSPLPTVTAGGQHFGLVVPIDNTSTKGGARPVDKPLSTITTKQRHGILTPLVMGQHSGSQAKPATHNPVPTITSVARVQMINPLIASYYGNGACVDVTKPLPTVTTKQRFGMLTPHSHPQLALSYRMLHVKELAAATSFPEHYKFAGNKTEQVKQIGNAVPPVLAYEQAKPYIEELTTNVL